MSDDKKYHTYHVKVGLSQEPAVRFKANAELDLETVKQVAERLVEQGNHNPAGLGLVLVKELEQKGGKDDV